MAGTGLTQAGDLLPNAAHGPAGHTGPAAGKPSRTPSSNVGLGKAGTRPWGSPAPLQGWEGRGGVCLYPWPGAAGLGPPAWQEEEGCLCRRPLRSHSAQQGEGTQHQSPLCAGSHKDPVWRRQQPSTENGAFRLGRAGGGSHGVRRHAAPAQGPQQHPATARAQRAPRSQHPLPRARTMPTAGRASAQERSWWARPARPLPHCTALPRLGPTQGSFRPGGWHQGGIWNRYGAAAISLCTPINVFVNSAQVRGESQAGQSYRRSVTLPFSPRVPAKFGFFSIPPLNLKIKNKH